LSRVTALSAVRTPPVAATRWFRRSSYSAGQGYREKSWRQPARFRQKPDAVVLSQQQIGDDNVGLGQ